MVLRMLMRFRPVVCLSIAAGLATACAAAPRGRPIPGPRIDTGPGSLAEARKYLEGTWSLVSMDVFPPKQPPIHVVGSGTMRYDDFANMTVDLRVDPKTESLLEQIGISAPNGVVSTTGRTTINLANKTLSYVLEGQAVIRPATHPLDTNRPRYWEADGATNTLTIRTKDDNGTVLSVAVWRKESTTPPTSPPR